MTIPAIFDMRGLRDRLARMLAPVPDAQIRDAIPLPPAYLRDLFDDPVVASWDVLPPPSHAFADLRAMPRQTTRWPGADGMWRP